MNNHENTLVILSPGFPESEEDSTCLPMQQQLVRSLKIIYPQLNIIILSFQYPYHKKKYDWFGVTVISFNGRNRGGWNRLMLRRKIFEALREINSRNKIIGLLSFWYGECALVGKRFGDRYRLKNFCWILGQDAKKENRYVKKVQLEDRELIALSDFLQDEFEKNHGIRPFIVIPPGIEDRQLTHSAKERDIELLAVGSLIPLKQFDLFLDIVATIKKQLPGVKALLLGKGPEKERLQILITDLGLKDNVLLTGELPNNEVLQLMQRTKVLLHTSSYEGFSGVCLEALSRGAHVISFCWAMKKTIQQWIIVQSEKQMKLKALEILEDPDRVHKEVIFFRIEDTARKMMSLFINQV